MHKKIWLVVMFGILVGLTACKDSGNSSEEPPPPPPLSENVNDADTDGIVNEGDNCPNVANHYQEDSNGNGVGDACEEAPPVIVDIDGDGVADDKDNCPNYPNPDQKDICTDTDKDGVADALDNCSTVVNADQQGCGDISKFGIACDQDCDGISDDDDNCKYVKNSDQKDDIDASKANNPNKIGDVCEDWDADLDGVSDKKDDKSYDNCPNTKNADQADLDGDGMGDVCDGDIDGDGYNNAVELIAGTDTNDKNDKPKDLDQDGQPDINDTNADGDSYDISKSDCDDLSKDVGPGKEDVIDDLGVDSNCDGIDGNIGDLAGILVAPDGNDSTNCGVNIQTPCKTVSHAISLITGDPKKYKSTKYILLAVAKNGDDQFNENVSLPIDVELRGGYCALESKPYNTKYEKDVPTYFYRKRDMVSCRSTINSKQATAIVWIDDGKSVIEGIDFKTNFANAPAIYIYNANEVTFTKNTIQSVSVGLQVVDSRVIISNNEKIIATGKAAKAISISWGNGISEIKNNGEISARGENATAIYSKSFNHLIIAENKTIKASGTKDLIGIDLLSGGKIEVLGKQNISVLATGNSDVMAAIRAESTDSVNIASGNDVQVSTNSGETHSEGYGIKLAKIDDVIIDDNKIAVGSSVDCNLGHCISNAAGIKISEAKKIPTSLKIQNSNTINGTAKNIDGINIDKWNFGSIESNVIKLEGYNQNIGMSTAIRWSGTDQKSSDNVAKINRNIIQISKANTANGLYVSKNDASLLSNKILLINGYFLKGINFVASAGLPYEDLRSLQVSRNAVVIGDVKKSGKALVMQGGKGVIDDNLLYGGWLKIEGSAVGINLIDSAPTIHFNTIIGGTAETKEGTVFALTDELSGSVVGLNLKGNIISAMTTYKVEDSAECNTYGIFLKQKDLFAISSSYNHYIDYNYFQYNNESESQFNDKYNYGMCFTLKMPNIPKEEQGVANINGAKSDSCSNCLGYKGNVYNKLKLEGDITKFVFYPVDKMVNQVSWDPKYTEMTDMFGLNRLFNGAGDIGAFEFSGPSITVDMLK